MDLAELSTSQVADLLQYLNLAQYKRLFVARSIDGAALALCHRLENVLRLGLSHDDAIVLFDKIQEFNRTGVPCHITSVTTPTSGERTAILAELSPNECIHLLHNLHLSQYESEFSDRHVDGAALALCHNIINVHNLGVFNATDAQKLLDAIHDYNILGVPVDHYAPTMILAELSPKQVISLLHHHNLLKYGRTVINKDIDGAALALCHRLSQVKKLGFANDADAAQMFRLIEIYNVHGVPAPVLKHKPTVPETKPLASLQTREVQVLLFCWKMQKYIRMVSERSIDGAALAMVHTTSQLSHFGFLTADIPSILDLINEYNETEVPLSMLDNVIIDDDSKLLSELTEKDVHQLLLSLEMEQYIPSIASHSVDGAFLAMCHRLQQLTRLGFSSGDAQRLLDKIEQWNTLGVSRDELVVPSTPLAELSQTDVRSLFRHIGLSDYDVNIRHYEVDGAALAMCHRVENLHHIGIKDRCDYLLNKISHFLEYDVPNRLFTPIIEDSHERSDENDMYIPLAQLRVEEVARLFCHLNLSQYVDIVRHRNIDGAALAMCHKKENLIALGITQPRDIEYLLSIIQRLLIRDVAPYMLENYCEEKNADVRRVRDLNTEEIIQWLEHLSLQQYTALFRRHRINGRILDESDARQLQAIGMTPEDAKFLRHQLSDASLSDTMLRPDIHTNDVRALHSLSVYDILRLLDYLELKQYKRVFVRDNIDGPTIASCSSVADLQFLGVTSGSDANYFYEKIEEYKKHGVPVTYLEERSSDDGKSSRLRK